MVAAFRNDSLRCEFERLTDHSLGSVLPVSALDLLIDQATGHRPAESPTVQRYMQAFAAFVREFVWLRLPVEARLTSGWVPDYPLRSGTGELLPC